MSRHQFKYAQHHFFFRTMAWLFRFSWILDLRRLIFRYIPYLRMESQAAETVYMSWLVDYDRVKQRFPEPIQLWQKDGKTIFSILFYHHHDFGPHCIGRLRKLFGSPKQSNWRFYLAPDQLEHAVVFEQIMVDNFVYVLGGRLLSDAMPAQYDPNFVHQVKQQQDQLTIQVKIEVDATYQLEAKLNQATETALPEVWQQIFPTWQDAIEFFVPQQHVWVERVDQAVKLSQADIRIDTDFDRIKTLQLEQLDCPLLAELGVDLSVPALCFYIPNLDFHVLNEHCSIPKTKLD